MLCYESPGQGPKQKEIDAPRHSSLTVMNKLDRYRRAVQTFISQVMTATSYPGRRLFIVLKRPLRVAIPFSICLSNFPSVTSLLPLLGLFFIYSLFLS